MSDEDYLRATSEILRAKKASGSLSKNHPFIRLDEEAVYFPPEPGVGVLKKFIDAERKFEKYITKPKFFEASFGLPIAKDKRDITLSLEDHIEIGGIKFRGKIDRIDMDDSGSVYTITDYKTRTAPSKKDIDSGTSLQLPLYLRIAEDLLRAHIGKTEMSGIAGLYHTLLGKESKQQLAFGLHEFAGRAFEGHKSGGKGRLQSEVEMPEELQKMIEATIEFAKSYVDGITLGKFPLVSETNRESACRYCDYKNVCRVGEAAESGALRK
jgi:ATP-dependent helicase/DNAse subunit B